MLALCKFLLYCLISSFTFIIPVCTICLLFSALPGDVTDAISPIPPTPVPKMQKSPQFFTRRSSSIRGEVFIATEFEFGRTLGTGFFGKAIQVNIFLAKISIFLASVEGKWYKHQTSLVECRIIKRNLTLLQT